jgi:twinkle protein
MMRNSQKMPCPRCPSSDAYHTDNKTGWGHCFSCGVNIPPDNKLIKELPITIPVSKESKPITPLSEEFSPFTKRNLLRSTCERYKVKVFAETDGKKEALYPLFSIDGEHVANKIRYEDKGFSYEGSPQQAGLFGRHAFEPGSAKTITVVEGQDDAMAAYQITGSKYPVVSVHSASSAENDVRKDFEYLNSFDNIVFAFDADEPGRKAAKACAGAGFPLGKVKILNLRKHKDANDYLLADEGEAFIKEWWQAPHFKPDGLKLGSDIWEEIIDRKESFSTPYPFEGLNKLTYGLRLSELVIITADTGVGKTSILKHMQHLLLTNPLVKEKEYGVGFLHLEEPNGDTALGLLSIHNSTPYHLPDTDKPVEALREAYDELLNNNRVVLWDHFGSNSVDAVIGKVRHMAALGCKYIFLDHLSIIVSDQSGDERRQLDEIATKLKTLTMELDLAVIAVIHTNRQGQIRGTAGVEQLANIVIRLQRDKNDKSEWRRNITTITVEKNRFCGYTGPACYLWYNKDTARLSELNEEEVLTFLDGDELDTSSNNFLGFI